MSKHQMYSDIDLVSVRRNAENLRSETLRVLFSGLRKRFSGAR